MHPTEDDVYIRLDELSGTSTVSETFTTNTSAEVYLKVLGLDSDPWMNKDSGWTLDLYLRSSTSGSWRQVAGSVTSSDPSDRIDVQAGIPAEMQAVAYYPMSFTAELTEPLLPDADFLNCSGHSEFPRQGVIEIEGEHIQYNGKNENGLVNLIRGYGGTTQSHHPTGLDIELFSGTFEIPIIIALDTGDGSGSGGAMHPSRCHRMEITIAEGTPPDAMFRYTCWYNQLTVNASSSVDPDGRVVAYQWDWTSDGTFDAEGMEAEHVYEKVGTYNVTLKVTDNDGMTDTMRQTVSPAQTMPESNSGGLLSFFTDNYYGVPGWAILVLACVVILLFWKGYSG